MSLSLRTTFRLRQRASGALLCLCGLWTTGVGAQGAEPKAEVAVVSVPSLVKVSSGFTGPSAVVAAQPAPWQDGVDRMLADVAAPVVLEQGRASYYANRFHGRRTASGERYNKNELTAAHKTLPFGTEVLVRSLQTGKEVVVRIIDRGPYLKGRIIDLSHAAAEALGIRQHGVSDVQLIQP